MIRPAGSTAHRQQGSGDRSHGRPTEGLSRDAWRAIRCKARQVTHRAGFTRVDRQDIEQELALRLWQALANYNPAKGRQHGFMATILHRAAVSLLRTRNSRQHGGRVVHQSLDLELSAEDALDIAGETSTNLIADGSAHEEALDLVHDVAVVLNRLPSHLRELAEQLKCGQPITRIAEQQGISRSTVYARIRELRACFVEAGLEKTS